MARVPHPHAHQAPLNQSPRYDPYGRPLSLPYPQHSGANRPNQQQHAHSNHHQQAYHTRTTSYPGQPLSHGSPMPSPQPRLVPSQPIRASSPPQYQTPPTRPPSYAHVPRNDNRHSGRYQPSRGAQRDAKWHAKYAERTQLATQFHQEMMHPQRPPGHQRMHSSPGRVPPPHPGQPYPPTGYVAQVPPASNMDRIRAEQQAAIAAARQTHAAAMARKAQEEEAERKTRRIQLQVFVHARPTLCCWDGCEALLNSWALLEKHIFHCHLHADATAIETASAPKGVLCKWDTCQDVFENNKDCYQHCLVDHMGTYSARCPFDCLFEGPKFLDLMAHIGRRHPKATPDDFVPGLVHHRPVYLPPTIDDLPKLPFLTIVFPDSEEAPKSVWACGNVKPFQGEKSLKVLKYVEKGCISGKRPRKEHYADKEGASAAISAIIQNSHKIADLYHNTQRSDNEGQGVVDPGSAKSISMTTDEAKAQGVEIIDVKYTARKAKDQAKKLVANDLLVEVDSSSDSVSGSRTSSRNATLSRPPLKVRLSGLRSKKDGETLELSESESESDTSASSRFSLYRAKRGVTGSSPVFSDGDAAAALKRSERLKRKAEEVGSPVEKSV